MFRKCLSGTLAPAFCTWKPNCLWSTFSLPTAPPPRGFPHPGMEPGSPAFQTDSLSHQGISIFLSDYWSFARVLYVSKIVALYLFYILSLSVEQLFLGFVHGIFHCANYFLFLCRQIYQSFIASGFESELESISVL